MLVDKLNVKDGRVVVKDSEITIKEKLVNYGIAIIGKPEFKEKQIEEIL